MLQLNSLKAGAVGALALNLIHESARKTIPNAPHVDQIAMRALDKYVFSPLHIQLSHRDLRRFALAGDLISNSLYYAAVVGVSNSKSSKSLWTRAWIFGLAAGIGAVVLPPYIRLGQQPSRKFSVTAALTVAWYTIGALSAAAVSSSLQRRR